MYLMTKKEMITGVLLAILGFCSGMLLNLSGFVSETVITHPLSLMLAFSGLFYWVVLFKRMDTLQKEGVMFSSIVIPTIILALLSYGKNIFLNAYPVGQNEILKYAVLFILFLSYNIFLKRYRK